MAMKDSTRRMAERTRINSPSKKGMKPLSGSEMLPRPNRQDSKHWPSPRAIQIKLSHRSYRSIKFRYPSAGNGQKIDPVTGRRSEPISAPDSILAKNILFNSYYNENRPVKPFDPRRRRFPWLNEGSPLIRPEGNGFHQELRVPDEGKRDFPGSRRERCDPWEAGERLLPA
jgi:hypothetical protein